ncbi:MAG: hypothetical protein OXE84_01815 [Rhodobacteraceae bacterium]|nr:hypothetical protein [Paracoccaceae bacterium]
MATNTVIPLDSPAESSEDALTEVLCQETRDLLQAAIQAELSERLRAHEVISFPLAALWPDGAQANDDGKEKTG